MTLAEIAVLAAEALDAASRNLDRGDWAEANAYALVSLAASHYLMSAAPAAGSPITSRPAR